MELPTQIELGVGETYRLRLPGLGTAGYLWTYEVITNSDLIDISAATARASSSVNEEGSANVGSSVDEIFILKAIKAGQVSIRFVQKRPWELNQLVLREQMFEVNIHN